MTDFSYANVDWAEGTKNLPGIKRNVYFLPKSEISAWPAFDELSNKYTANFTIGDNTWKRLQVVMRKSPVTSEMQGEPENATHLNKATFIFAGTSAAALAFAAKANRDDLVFLVEDRHGVFHVIGHEDFRTMVRAGVALGTEGGDEKGITMEIECTDAYMLPTYEDAIYTTDGNVNPDSTSE